jgi:hypothetical protein
VAEVAMWMILPLKRPCLPATVAANPAFSVLTIAAA